MLKPKALLTVLAVAMSFVMLSCNGNGGSADSVGETYTPGGASSTSSGSGSSGGGSSGDRITATDILNSSNSSEGMETLIDKLATGGMTQNGTAGTQTVTFSADDIGLPSGGSAALTISGDGCNYSGLASADADGNVNFEIPMIASGSRITVSLVVKTSGGTILYSGSKEQTVRGSSAQIEVALARQFWTLPASIRAVASPAAILYRAATADTVSSTLSVEGLDGAPAGISYVWTDESGSQLGTEPTLTRTANEVTGGITPADEITKTYTVTVSYTDAAGEARTASASASVTVGGPVILPAFSITCTAPASMDGSVGSESSWALPTLEDDFTLTPVSSTGSFPGGTTFRWEIQAAGGGLITRTTATGEDCTVSPADLELDDSSIGTQAAPTTITVRCTASNERADTDVDAPDITQDAYLFYFIPAFTVTITPPAGYVADKSDESDPSNPSFALTDATGTFSFTPVSSTGLFPAGTTFHWGIESSSASGPVAAELPSDTTADEDASSPIVESGLLAASDVGYTPDNAASFAVTCTASNPHALSTVEKTAHASAFMLYTLPEFTIDIDMDTDGYSDASSDLTTDPDNPVYALTNLTKEFTFTAVADTSTLPAGTTTFPWGTADFPEGTKFQWKITGELASGDVAYEPALSAEDDVDIAATVDLFGLTDGTDGTLGFSSVSANTITIECTATHDYAIEDVDATAASAKTFRAPPDGFAPVEGNGGTVGNLYVCIHEVTQGEYENYCTYGGTSTPSSSGKGVGSDYPVYYVSWYDALVYCNKRSEDEGLTCCYTIKGSTNPAAWGTVPTAKDDNWDAVIVDTSANGYRLPTSDEWYQAANDGHSYSGSDDINEVAWYSNNSGDSGGSTNKKSHPVKTKNPNAKGIYDMTGNVKEFCWDIYSSYNRVYRGGSFQVNSDSCALSNRYFINPSDRDYDHGFRVVRKAE